MIASSLLPVSLPQNRPPIYHGVRRLYTRSEFDENALYGMTFRLVQDHPSKMSEVNPCRDRRLLSLSCLQFFALEVEMNSILVLSLCMAGESTARSPSACWSCRRIRLRTEPPPPLFRTTSNIRAIRGFHCRSFTRT